MGRHKGSVKTGGRKKGTRNKDTQSARDIAAEKNYRPIAQLIRIAAIAEKEYKRAAEIFDAIQEKRAAYKMVPLSNDKVPEFLKVMQKSAAEVAPYLHPRLKSIDIKPGSGDDGVTWADLVRSIVDKKKNNEPSNGA